VYDCEIAKNGSVWLVNVRKKRGYSNWDFHLPDIIKRGGVKGGKWKSQ